MQVLVYGSGDFGKVVSALVRDCGHNFVGFIDDQYQRRDVVGTYLSCLESHPPSHHAIAIAIGYRWLGQRQEILQKLHADGYSTPAMIHPRAYVSNNATVGDASLIMAHAVIDTLAVVRQLCVVWPGAVINHESRLADNIFVGPNSTVCGGTEIRSNCFIGAGAVITDHITIPENTFVKAGSVFSRRSVATQFEESHSW
jgi:sugar O-acyltransferase (sialic acid O-acetyltransferase NeuD family)